MIILTGHLSSNGYRRKEPFPLELAILARSFQDHAFNHLVGTNSPESRAEALTMNGGETFGC